MRNDCSGIGEDRLLERQTEEEEVACVGGRKKLPSTTTNLELRDDGNWKDKEIGTRKAVSVKTWMKAPKTSGRKSQYGGVG